MEGELWGLATHPSKLQCVTASDDQSVRVWDLEAHRIKTTFSVDKPARCVAYSHNGRAIAVGMKDGELGRGEGGRGGEREGGRGGERGERGGEREERGGERRREGGRGLRGGGEGSRKDSV